jgi:hypothetical protein
MGVLLRNSETQTHQGISACLKIYAYAQKMKQDSPLAAYIFYEISTLIQYMFLLPTDMDTAPIFSKG